MFEHTAAFYISELRRSFCEYTNEQLSQFGLMQGQMYFILYIGKHEGCAPMEMRTALKMDAGHVARSINKLQKDGFVLQKKDENDKRKHKLYLTKKGQQAFGCSYEILADWDKAMLENLTKEEKDELQDLLCKVLNTVNEKK